MRRWVVPLTCVASLAGALHAQTAQPDWTAVEAETLRHFSELVRFDTSDPPGHEKPAADYLAEVLRIDVRMHPDEEPDAFLAAVRKVVADPAVEVRYAQRATRPGSRSTPLDSEGFKAVEAAVKKHYQTVALPTMATGATDMAFLRAKGMQCYGIGPAVDVEDGPKGFGAHSDQERILERELHRFVRLQYDIVLDLARAR